VKLALGDITFFSKKNCLLVRGKLNFNEKILQFAAWHAVLDIAIKDAA